MDFFLWDHIKAVIYTSPVDSEVDLIACSVEAAATNGQQPGVIQDSRQSSCVVIGFVWRSVAVHLNICFKLVRNTNPPHQNTSMVLLDFQL
jgi:hypothetical protein